MIKIASYCRVSTDKEDQANSFASQQLFFREYIAHHPDWELYEVYADEGVTGTSTKKRVQFNRMINDAYNNKFKLIITKEISRFSRNLLDTIAYTRELKALGIGVVFMSDGFCSLDPDAELRLSIMGSIAQEESRKTSARVKWGQTRQMERGVVFGTSLLGYDVENGKIHVNSEESNIVKLIFYKYGIEKKGTTTIARELREAGYRTHSGNPIWSNSHIIKILKNEKYVGDLIQKKTITTDYLTHTKKSNCGEEDLIVLKDHHEPIISRELWDLVQQEIRKRHRAKRSTSEHSNRYICSGKILCAECGCRFISRKKTRKDGSSYRRWGCYTASREGKQKTDIHGNIIGCNIGKQLRDDLLMSLLKYVLQHLDIDRDCLVKDLTSTVCNVIRSGRDSEDTRIRIRRQIDLIQKKKMKAIDVYLSGDLSKEDFWHMKMKYETELLTLEEQMNTSQSADQSDISPPIHQIVKDIMLCEEISEPYLKSILEHIVIHQDGTLEIKLNQLSTVWKFQVYNRNQYYPEAINTSAEK